ncbi:hypothetical protein [Pseudorhodobacter sp.]|uniref:hypothetical protein n=1 Tax=Pseudorhodobacter sp. TaxID=1934400 RepID=UPI0026495525|nr:hypothetical protein [Pseudorhodobacter sp.]MDN5787204.1 hypothetical protein [Pseudorhodobacter sp.]
MLRKIAPLKATIMRALVLALSVLTATAAFGETQMTGKEFEAYSTGKTLTYASEGQIYGVEQYLTDRRVRWAFVDDTCRIGHWYEDSGNICFVYEHDATPQCWTFHLTNGHLMARFISDPPSTELSEVNQTDQPLACTGPDVGV